MSRGMTRMLVGSLMLVSSVPAFFAGFVLAAAVGLRNGSGLATLAGMGGIMVSIILLIAGVAYLVSGFNETRAEARRSASKAKAEVEVTLDAEAYLPGDTVGATVRISGKEDFAVRDARASLVRRNVYRYKTEYTNSEGRHTTTKTATDEVVVAAERFLVEGSIRVGGVAEREFAFELPHAAAPTAKGRITEVDWKVRVALDVPRGPDVNEDRAVTVLSPAGAHADRAESEPECAPPDACGMEFRLPSRSFGAGERVEGALVVAPREDSEVRALRVELVRREVVPRGKGNVSETVEASEELAEELRFAPGTHQEEYGFGLAVPEMPACPCLETQQTRVDWWLRAVADRKRRPGSVLKQELNVYNGPAAGPAAQSTEAGEPA